MENNKLQIIFPKDETTDFLQEIIYYLQEVSDVWLTIHRPKTKAEHLYFLQNAEQLLPENEPILFMGHGTSGALSGAAGTSYSHGEFINETELSLFKKRKIMLLSCRSNEYLSTYGLGCGLNAGVGFPNMITDPIELIYPEDPERVVGISYDEIQTFKSIIVDIVKYSLQDYIDNDYSFYQLYKRLKLRAQKILLDYYHQNSNKGILPLGRMLYDFNDGINFIGN